MSSDVLQLRKNSSRHLFDVLLSVQQAFGERPGVYIGVTQHSTQRVRKVDKEAELQKALSADAEAIGFSGISQDWIQSAMYLPESRWRVWKMWDRG